MKTILFFLAGVLMVSTCDAQIKDPVKWTFNTNRITEDSYEIRLTATIEDGWHIYSQFTSDGGPTATVIDFANNPLIIFSRETKEVGKLEQKLEPIFGVDVKQYSKKVEFIQTVKLKSKVKTTITGSVEFMACNNVQCTPPTTRKFSLKLM